MAAGTRGHRGWQLVMRHAFTLIEVLITVAILAIVAALAIPALSDTDAMRVDSARRLLISDLEHAQVLAIARPGESISLRIDEDGQGWYLSESADPLTPLLDTITGSPLALRMGEGRGAPAAGTIAAAEGGSSITFDHHGGLTDFTADASITLQAGDATTTVTITSATGTIQ